MKTFLKIAALFTLGLPLSAQTLSVYPTAVSIPRGGYQTVTAVVTGVNNKTVTWSTDGGTIKGANPCVVNEPCAVALYSTTPGTYHLTATSNANGAVTAISTITVTASPTPVTTYPRLLVNAAGLTSLRAKYTGGDPNLAALKSQGIAYFTADNAIWSWTCNGGTGLPSSDQLNNFRENDAYIFSYLAMAGPSDGTYNWGCYAHDVWTYVIARYQSFGNIPGGANEWSDASQSFALTPNWLMTTNPNTGNPYLSPTEQTNTKAFQYWLIQLVLSQTAGGDQSPVTGYSSPSQFVYAPAPVFSGNRSMGNNYAQSYFLLLVGAGLTWNDPGGAPDLTNTCSATRYQVCPDYSAGSLAAYWRYFVGSWGYRAYAHFEDPGVSRVALNDFFANMPTPPTCQSTDTLFYPCLGDGRGGESSEGSYYGYSFYRLRYALDAIYTAGFLDPMVYGPQLSLASSSWWDMKYVSDLQFLLNFPAQTGRPAYHYLMTGDSNNYYRLLSDAWSESAMLMSDSITGRTDRTNALLWITMNYSQGGPLGTAGGCSSNCGWNNNLANGNFSGGMSLDIFAGLGTTDPLTALPTDPRPSLPLDLYNASYNQHQMVRDSWTNPTMFSFSAGNAYINHEHDFDGGFDLFANGEYLTKRRAIFNDYNAFMTLAAAQNTLSIFNSTGSGCGGAGIPGCQPFWASLLFNGQSWGGGQNGFSTLLHSELPAYAADIVNMPAMYNGAAYNGTYASYNDVSGASRSAVYLRGTKEVVYYDRATVGHGASVQATSINTTGAPTISGTQASWLTRSASQKVFYTTLLPAGATFGIAKLPQFPSLSAPFQNLHIGSTMQAVCTGTYADGSTANVSNTQAQWYSDNTAAITVNSTGLITAIGAGTSLIHCNWNGVSQDGQGQEAQGNVTGISGSSSGTFTMSNNDTDQTNDWEPYTSLKVSPSGTPTSSQFLSVLEWGNSGFAPLTPTLVQSSAGQNFEGALVNDASILVMFIRSPATFTGTTYPATGATRHYVSDLTPNTTYGVSGTGAPATATTDNAGVMTFAATGTGNIVISTVSPTVATPTSSPTPGTYTSTQSVTLADSTPGASICFTTNGATPAATTAGTCDGAPTQTYTGAISVSSTTTIKAIGTLSGSLNSSVLSATYTITPPAATPTFSPVAGTYTSVQTVTISTTTPSPTLYYTTDGSTPTTSSTVYSGPITVSASETVKAIATASGFIQSAVGSAAYVINLPAAATPTFSPVAGTYTSAQTVTISTTTTSPTLYYTTDGSTPTTSSTVYSGPITVATSETVKAIATASGFSTSAVGSAAYVISIPQAATPTFSPVAGTYTSTQTVTLACSTASPTMYYTTDGSTPTTGSTVYSTPISVAVTTTVKAICTASGFTTSAVGTAVYTLQTITPTCTPAAGTYTSTQSVTCSSATPSSSTFCTIDGSTPTTSSPACTAISVGASLTLKAISSASGHTNSSILTQGYVINIPTTGGVVANGGNGVVFSGTVNIP